MLKPKKFIKFVLQTFTWSRFFEDVVQRKWIPPRPDISYSLSCSLSHSLFLTHYLSLTHSRSLTLTLSLSHPFSYILSNLSQFFSSKKYSHQSIKKFFTKLDQPVVFYRLQSSWISALSFLDKADGCKWSRIQYRRALVDFFKKRPKPAEFEPMTS